MIALKQLIEQRQKEHANLPAVKDVLTICEHVAQLLEGQAVQIDSLMQAQIHINDRLHAVERLVSTYQPPRG